MEEQPSSGVLRFPPCTQLRILQWDVTAATPTHSSSLSRQLAAFLWTPGLGLGLGIEPAHNV